MVMSCQAAVFRQVVSTERRNKIGHLPCFAHVVNQSNGFCAEPIAT